MMVCRWTLAAAALLLLACCAHGAPGMPGCKAVVDSSTQMFGAPWSKSFLDHEQESEYRQNGDLIKVTLYYNEQAACLQGVKGTYGPASSQSKLLGVDNADGKPLSYIKLQLTGSEVFTAVEYKVGKCIEYLKLTTSNGRSIQIGNAASEASLQTNKPAAGSFLGFFKGTTDMPTTAVAGAGSLQQLQLVWMLKRCEDMAKPEPVLATAKSGAGDDIPMPMPTFDESSTDDSAGGSTADKTGKGQVSIGVKATPPANGNIAISKPEQPTNTTGNCQPNRLCKNDQCPTSSCAINGMGKDILAMFCWGTNIFVPSKVLNLTLEGPCQNLACKLTKPNCTSIGLLGVGGFCTGNVVAMGATAKLHPTSQALLGYPCIEHKGPMVDLVPLGDYSAKGTYVAKAWKVCDCINGSELLIPEIPAAKASSQSKGVGIAVGITDLLKPSKPAAATIMVAAAQKIQQPQQTHQINMTTPQFVVPSITPSQFATKPVTNITLPDVLAQWVTAWNKMAPLQRIVVPDAKVDALKALIPGFTAPSLVIPNISAPLLKMPKDLRLPVFTITPKTLPSVALLLPNITSLPSLVVAKPHLPDINIPPVLSMLNVTIPSLQSLADKFMAIIPSLEVSFDVPDVIAQWVAGIVQSVPLQKIAVADETLAKLKALLPDLPQLPSLIMVNVSSPYFAKPSTEGAKDLPTVVIPDKLVPQVTKFLANLTALPSVLVPEARSTGGFQHVNITLPSLTLPNVTLPDLKLKLGQLLGSLPLASQLGFTGDTGFDKGVNATMSVIEQIGEAASSLESAVKQVLGDHGLGVSDTRVANATQASHE